VWISGYISKNIDGGWLAKECSLIRSYGLDGSTRVKRKWICLYVGAVCHLELNYACSIETSICREMINGVSGTKGAGK